MHCINHIIEEVKPGVENLIEASINEEVESESDYSGGLAQPIRWLSGIEKDREAAEERIEKSDSGWYDQLAVKFYGEDKKVYWYVKYEYHC